MRKSCRLAAIPLFILGAPLGATQQKVDDTIVVKGTRIDPGQARDRAITFVKQTGVATGQQQVARWVVPVCIKVIGLSDPQEARVVGQMLAIAREAKIPVGKVDCEPNLTVTFAPDAGEIVRHINARKPNQFRELSRLEKEQLINGNAPVRWWYATEMMDRDGVKANNVSPGWISAGEGSGVPGNAVTSSLSIGGEGDITSTQQYNSGSNVRTATVRSLFGATVIVDATKAASAGIDALSAYAAMVAFAEMSATAAPPDSILGLFQPTSIENSLTDWDMAFLKSLYRMPLDRRSRIQRGHLVEALLDERLPDERETKKP
jgi:hypothetical protein